LKNKKNNFYISFFNNKKWMNDTFQKNKPVTAQRMKSSGEVFPKMTGRYNTAQKHFNICELWWH
jgi:hypothetical protein